MNIDDMRTSGNSIPHKGASYEMWQLYIEEAMVTADQTGTTELFNYAVIGQIALKAIAMMSPADLEKLKPRKRFYREDEVFLPQESRRTLAHLKTAHAQKQDVKDEALLSFVRDLLEAIE